MSTPFAIAAAIATSLVGAQGDLELAHVPLSQAKAGEAASLDVQLHSGWGARTVTVHLAAGTHRAQADDLVFERFGPTCRATPSAVWDARLARCSIRMLRQLPAPTRDRPQYDRYGVVIPGAMIQPPGVRYHITAVAADGSHRHFASAEAPYPVAVHGESASTRQAVRLERHRGHRNRLQLSGAATFFGEGQVKPINRQGIRRSTALSDRFWELDLTYTHRLLEVLYAYRIGLGYMDGWRPTFFDDDGVEYDIAEGPQPGLLHGWAELDLEVHTLFGVALKVVLGAGDTGFAGGVGADLRVGPRVGTHGRAGFDWVSNQGARGWLEFAWDTVPYMPMAIRVEFSELPSFDDLATRMILRLGFEISDSFDLAVRVGYAKRLSSYTGGFMAGLSTGVEF